MENYIGRICPFCKTEIKLGDAVKVCPTCGTPHHKSCWKRNKGCATFGCSEQHYEAQGTNSTDVCPNCGTPLEDGQAFCPECGTAKRGKKKNICGKCGAELQDGYNFCRKCGQKIGSIIDTGMSSATNQFNAGVQKKSKEKIIAIIGIIAVVTVVLFLVFRGSPVEEITLSKSSVELMVDNSTSVSYTISPAKASYVEVSWKSSDDSVATVNNHGVIVAKGEGTCTITATADGKSDSLQVTVRDIINFAEMFREYSGEIWFDVASDGSYMSVDTNRFNIEDYFDSDAYYAIEKINSELGFSDALLNKMKETNALDGRQTESNDKYTVSWKYHPDNGLEVTYEINN